PKQVLMDRYETEAEADEPEDFEGDVNDLYDDELFYKESEAIPKLYSNTTAPAARNNANSTTAVNTTYNAATSANRANNGSLGLEGEMGGVNPVMTHSADITLEGGIGGNLAGTGGTSEGGEGVGGTTIPNGFNDTISEVDVDIDLQTPIPVPSVSKNENYISYAPTTNLYGTLGPSNTLLSQSSTAGSVTSSLMSNTTIMCGPRQSPDILGISSQVYAPTSGSSTTSPAIGGTVVPISSLTQYTTAPTFRSGYLLNSENVLQRPPNIGTPPTSMANNETYLCQQYQQQPQHHQQPPTIPMQSNTTNTGLTSATSTLRRIKQTRSSGATPSTAVTASPPLPSSLHLQQQQSNTAAYDGLAPRTLSTGVAVNSQFYYG
ncbi:hypothetical protein DOY81_011115, partial [Sarcophaga bullata]